MSTWVHFIIACLWNRNYQTSSKATAEENRHYANVEQHGSVSVHLFHTWNSSIKIIMFVVLWSCFTVEFLTFSQFFMGLIWNLVGSWGDLTQKQWLLMGYLYLLVMNLIVLLCNLLTKTYWHVITDMGCHVSSWINHYLGKVGNTLHSCILNLVEFVPKIFLDLAHIAPQVHPIGFNISNLLLI